MSSAVQPDSAPLEIRGRPKPVKRVSRRALMILIGSASAIILGSLAYALQGPKEKGPHTARELYNTGHNPEADGLTDLPKTYSDIEPVMDMLGPPLPGDLGAPVLKARREGRLDVAQDLAQPMKQMSVGDMERQAEAFARVEAARSSEIFFKTSQPSGAAAKGLNAPLSAGPSMGSIERSALEPETIGALRASHALDPNLQSQKRGLISASADPDIYNPHRLETPLSPYQLMASTVIPATLLTGVNSDLPGQIIAQVTSPVYDTVTGDIILIPQGARLIGRYDNAIAFGQSRALLVWSRIIMPDGSSIRIDDLAGIDARGYAGLEDTVDYHGWRLFQGVALSTLLGIGSELASDDEDEIVRAVRRSAQTGANQAGQEIVRRHLDVQPTIMIRPGWRFGVLVNKDIILKPYEGGISP